MAISFVNKGTWAAGTTSIAPGIPAAMAAGDLMLLVVHTPNGVVSAVTNWTQVTGSPISTGTANTAGGVRLTVYYRWWQSGDAAPTVAVTSGTATNGMIFGYRGVDSTTPFDATPTSNTVTPASTTLTMQGITTATANAWVVHCVARDQDLNNAAAVATPVNANLTGMTERHDQVVNTATGGGIYVQDGIKATAGATGNTTATQTSSIAVNLTVALRPLASVDATGTGSLSSSSLTAPDSTATGGASATGSLSAITATAPTATATGSAEATGSLSVLALTAPTGEATSVVIVNASVSGDLASVALNAANAMATGGATATGSLAAVTQTAPTATATGTATAAAACAAIALTAPTSAATGTAAASGALQLISLTAPTGTASGEAVVNGNASGSLASISLTAATAQAVANAQAVAVFASLQINPATGAAYGTANASGVMAGISITAMTATARGTDPSVPEPGALVYRPGRQNNGKRPAQTGGTRYATGNTTRPARVARVNR